MLSAPQARLCGGESMPSNFLGPKPYGAPQESEMDAAWQELMAITELQEFGASGESTFDTAHYQTMESMTPIEPYNVTAAQPPGSSELSTNYGCYIEEVPAHHGSNMQSLYGHSDSQINLKVLPSEGPFSLTALREQVFTPGGSRSHWRDSTQGLKPHTQWTRGQTSHGCLANDLESDSGLSLGSSPPLASPDVSSGVAGYQSIKDCHAERLPEDCHRAGIIYSMCYQDHDNSYLHSGPHFSIHNSNPPNASVPLSLKPYGQVSSINDLYDDYGVPSRGGSRQVEYNKPRGSSFTPSPMSRDERRALALKIPFPLDKIINLPVDDFNELLSQYTLTDTQLALVRDIRRRGKNKVAAQNCRKRKLESIMHLEQELHQLQAQREHLAQERLEFQRSIAFIKCRLSELYTEVFTHLRDEDGQPYSIDEYALQQTPDGNIYLVPLREVQE